MAKYSPKTKDELKELVQDESVNLGDIDTSAITDMSNLFEDSDRKDFSGIEKWDTSRVTNMSYMFSGAEYFNENINLWNVKNVEYMTGMFQEADSFNQPLDLWNVSNVIEMATMFCGADSFNQSLDLWNVSNANIHCYMFSDSPLEFKSPDWYYDIVSQDELMEQDEKQNQYNKLLQIRKNLIQNSEGKYVPINKEQLQSLLQDKNIYLGNIDTSKITDMSNLFWRDKRKDFSGIEKWNVSNVSSMRCMFNGAKYFNANIGEWNVANVTLMNRMFCGAKHFNQPLDSWNVSNVVDMSDMFNGAMSFNQDLSDWGDKLGKVKSMDSMFEVTPSLAINFLSVWKIPEYCTKENMTQHSRLESDESNLIPSKLKPNECVYRITQVECDLNNIKDFRLSENNKIKFLEEWIPKNILKDYNIFFAKAPHKKNDDKSKENKSNFKIYAFDDIEKMDYEGSRDGWLWDFAFYEVLGYKFMIEKGNNILANGIKRTNISFEIQIKDIDIAKDKKYNSNTKFYDNKLSVSFSNQTMIVWIQKGANQNDILDILNVYMIAKAYNTKMDELGKNARDANEKRKTINAIKKPLDKWLPFSKAKQANKKLYDELKKSYEEVCNFDLHSYHNIPIVQVDKSALMSIWQDISQKYMVQDKHDELKETISRVTQLVSDERQENLNYIMYWVAILSAIAAIFSAIPILQNFIAWISSKI